jgi:aspartate/tyrosine/aromatic aminotransferase
VATIQTLGGSGALKVGADFLKKYFPDSGVWVSDPTWENHVAIFEGAGFKVATYPWFDSETNGVRVDALLEKLNTLPARSIVLLHPCCHNPTGADLTNAQWDAVIEVLKTRDLIPFLDIAYQGFGAGMEEDAYAIRAAASAGLPVLVSNSFSKIFSLYGERVGGLSVVCEDAEAAGRVLGQLKATVRRIYSSPPNFGAQVVATVLGDETLKASWLAEVEAMRKRILSMRQALVNVLKEAVPGHNFDLAARDVQLYRTERGAGRSPARRVRCLPDRQRPYVRGGPECQQRSPRGAGVCSCDVSTHSYYRLPSWGGHQAAENLARWRLRLRLTGPTSSSTLCDRLLLFRFISKNSFPSPPAGVKVG